MFPVFVSVHWFNAGEDETTQNVFLGNEVVNSFLLNCLRKSQTVCRWREWSKLERTCLLAASTETEDTWVFFLKLLMGLKANTFCKNKQQWMYYAMLEIRVSLFLEQQYKFSCALLFLGHLTVRWFTSELWYICATVYICTGECNGTELSVIII